MRILQDLEKMGYRFELQVTFKYVKPDKNPPEEAAELLEELAGKKDEAMLFLAERRLYPKFIRISERYRAAINKSRTLQEAFDNALSCISAMTGDTVLRVQNQRRWLS